MAFSAITHTMVSTVATSGTFTVSYPAGQSAALYTSSLGHKLYAMGAEYLSPGDFTIAFNAPSMTVTWLEATSLASGSTVRLQVERLGSNTGSGTLNARLLPAPLVFMDLGAPLTVATNGLALSQSVAAAATFNLNGARATGGIGYFDAPRNVTAAWTGTSVLTIRGLDVDRQPVTETTASGVTHTGTKTFSVVNTVTSSAAITAATIGFGLSLGLPWRVPHASHVLYEIKNGVVQAISGTLTIGVTTVATGTTGDVRGRYVTSVAPNGTDSYGLLAVMLDPQDRGVPQYAA